MKREFLMLAHKYDSKKHWPTGYFVSEKLDGMRAFWDGGVSREIPCEAVPWANTEKDGRLLTEPVATGLWTRYGKPIHAPGWWLKELPLTPLDGELWIDRGKFQELMSIVKDHNPTEEWKHVQYKVFDSPNLAIIFSNGEIDNTNFKKVFNGIDAWLKEHDQDLKQLSFTSTFESTLEELRILLRDRAYVSLHQQLYKLSNNLVTMKEELKKLSDELPDGAEGLMLRRPASFWTPERSHNLLKIKPFHDAEALVLGYSWGRETDKGSKLLGLMGSMVVQFQGKEFELSGFTDSERVMSEAITDCPGERVSNSIWNPKFPRGSLVTFRYRELTDSGRPKEARFLRKYEGS